MGESKLILYELPDTLREQMDLPAVRYPIREEKQSEIFQKTGVRLDGFLEELDHFVGERPDAAETFRDSIAKIAYVAAIANGNRGDADTAVRMLELGLKHNPDNISLRANYAYGLQILRRDDEARAEYDQLLEATDDPFLRLLAARAAGDAGDKIEARRIIDGCPHSWWKDPEFAGLVGAFTESLPPVVPQSTAPAESCHACGEPLHEGQPFCTSCGQPRKTTSKCASCGNELEEEHRFCAKCGTSRPEAPSTDSSSVPPPIPSESKPGAVAAPPDTSEDVPDARDESDPSPSKPEPSPAGEPAASPVGKPAPSPVSLSADQSSSSVPTDRPPQATWLLIGHCILAGLIGIACLMLSVLAANTPGSEVAVLVAVGLLLTTGLEALVAWAIGKGRRWAQITGVVIVSLLSVLWVLGLVSGVMEISDGGSSMEFATWVFFIICVLATPLSAAILVLSFLRPVRQWIAARPTADPIGSTAGEKGNRPSAR